MGVGVEVGGGAHPAACALFPKPCRSDGRAGDNEGGSVSGGESIWG